MRLWDFCFPSSAENTSFCRKYWLSHDFERSLKKSEVFRESESQPAREKLCHSTGKYIFHVHWNGIIRFLCTSPKNRFQKAELRKVSKGYGT